MSNNLLLDDRSIVLLPQLAMMVGVSEAIFLQQIHYFNKDKDIDNDWFTSSLEKLHRKYFPFWSFGTVRNIKDRLIYSGYLEVKKSRVTSGNHTLSYRVNKKKLFADLSREETQPVMRGDQTPAIVKEGASPGTDLSRPREIPTSTPLDSPEIIRVSGEDLPMTHVNKINSAPVSPPAPGRIKRPEDVEEDLWQEFLAHRKVKRSPVSNRVIQMFRDEARKANLTLRQAIEETLFRGWQGFKAEWYLGKPTFQKRQLEIVDKI